MNFKEWFKPVKNIDENGTADQKQAVLEQAQNEAHALEKIARHRLYNTHDEQVGKLSPEFQMWLIDNFPKTSDDSLANDYAQELLSEGYAIIEQRMDWDDQMKQTIELMYRQLSNEHQTLATLQARLREMQYDLYRYQYEKNLAQQISKTKPAMASDDEFFNHDYGNGTSAVDYRDEQEQQKIAAVNAAVVELDRLTRHYADSIKRWNALTKQDGSDINRFAQNN